MIRVAYDGLITTITLDRADKRNAMTPEMLEELVRVIDAMGQRKGTDRGDAIGGTTDHGAMSQPKGTDRGDAIGGTTDHGAMGQRKGTDRGDAIGGTTDGGTKNDGAGTGGVLEPGRAVVLAGEGSVFCAGFDLALCAASPDGSVMRALLTGLSEAIAGLKACVCPVVIAAHGAAIAGGCALLGGADVVVADRGAKLGYPVLRIGVSPAVSGPFLAAMVGFGHARTRMLDTALISGVEAERIGLVHEVVDGPGDVLPRARAIAKELAAKPADGMAATKRWLNEIEEGIRGVNPARGLEVSMRLTGGEEEKEGIRRAMSKT